MARLIYSMITSLDGYTEDEKGSFDWSRPDQQVHTFVNELGRSVGTYLYGRRMYETMAYWETADAVPDQPPYILQWARAWQATEKIVYSRTLERVAGGRTRIERDFDIAVVERMKAAADLDITVEGPTLAGQALEAGLVDEVHQLIAPVVVGNGTRFFPDDIRIDLQLLDERRFDNGVVFVRYGIKQ